jgi:hypothetical protein
MSFQTLSSRNVPRPFWPKRFDHFPLFPGPFDFVDAVLVAMALVGEFLRVRRVLAQRAHFHSPKL